MQSVHGTFHPTRFQDVAVTVDFHCNSACTFCIVKEGMNHFKGVSLERFVELAHENQRSHKYQRVIFTGGEVTLERSLFDYVHAARESHAFEHVRVQTNARRLADLTFAKSLVDAGVDEFFVSIHGDTAELQDAISARAGSFSELIAGLDNLALLKVRVITNTVLHPANLRSLEGIVRVAHARGVERMEFWNYLPMEDHADVGNHIAPIDDLMPALRSALDLCTALNITPVTKYVPRCLLGAHGETLDNGQADVIIVENFWNEFPRFSCLYEALCEHSDQCLGLAHDYVNKFGWEESVLVPTPRTDPWEERVAADLTAKPEEYPDKRENVTARVIGHPAWEALLADLPESLGRVINVNLSRNNARFKLELKHGGATVDLVLAARDDDSPALSRTQSFNIFYNSVDGKYERDEMTTLLRAAADSIAARDTGALTLDTRKGLVQLNRNKPRPRRA